MEWIASWKCTKTRPGDSILGVREKESTKYQIVCLVYPSYRLSGQSGYPPPAPLFQSLSPFSFSPYSIPNALHRPSLLPNPAIKKKAIPQYPKGSHSLTPHDFVVELGSDRKGVFRKMVFPCSWLLMYRFSRDMMIDPCANNIALISYEVLESLTGKRRLSCRSARALLPRRLPGRSARALSSSWAFILPLSSQPSSIVKDSETPSQNPLSLVHPRDTASFT